MAWVATAIIGSAVLGAGASAYGAHEQNKAQEEAANNWNSIISGSLENDKEVQQWTKDMWRYGSVDGWAAADGSEPRTTPYQSSEREGYGYYVDKNGMVWDQARYDKQSRRGKKGLEKYGKITWIPVTRKADDKSSQYELEKKQLEYSNLLAPKAYDYTDKSLAAATELIEPQKQAARAEAQYTIDATPEKSAADIAMYKYTQQALPEKFSLIQAMSGLARRNTETEAANMAGAEVAQAFNTKQQELGDSIRRTGAVAGSGRMAGLQEDLDLERTKATAGARTAARRNARSEQYANLAQAVQLL